MHYSNSDSARFHGWQMACAQEANNRWFWRSAWDSPRAWVEMIHSGNIGSQTVSNSDMVDGYHASISTLANHIVVREGNGYILGNYINMSDNSVGSGVTGVIVKQGDNYYRTGTAGAIQSFLGLGSLAYSSATIPTNNNQLTNGAGYITGVTNISGSSGSTSAVNNTGFGNGNFTWYQSPGGLQQYTGSWASFLISNHGAGVDYYNQTIIMPFWGVPQYMRKEGNVNRGPWDFITGENIASQSVASAGRATRANGNFYVDDNYGNTVVGVYESTRLQGVWAMGDAYKLSADGTSAANHYGIAWSHPNHGGTAGRLTNHGMLIQGAGSTWAAISDSIWCIGDITAFSDARVKTNIEVIDNPLDRLNKVRGVTFTRTDLPDTTKRYAGVIAQEMREALPEVVTEDGNGELSVSYGNTVSLLIESIKAQQVQIEELKAEVKKLRGE
jgi:hypothetical protein